LTYKLTIFQLWPELLNEIFVMYFYGHDINLCCLKLKPIVSLNIEDFVMQYYVKRSRRFLALLLRIL